MASLPPRKNGPQSKASKQSPSPLDVLLQMGFKQNRAEKALAATGDRGVQLASDWLLAHVNDPRIDDPQPRLFYLYACPTGPLLQQLEDFRRRALNQCGANGAHSLLPHVTLAAPFQVAHHKASALSAALERQLLAERPTLPGRWRLERYVSQNFMGLFVDEQQAEALRATTNQLAAEAARHGVKIEPQTKALHLTLAYQFPASQFQLLEKLAADVDPAAPAQWEIRLYSRDPRLDGTDVYRVLYAHVPREPDELELVVGDYVYVSRGALHVSPDGWVEACSWLTGQVGFLPNNYVLAVPESDAWTVHRVVPLCGGDSDDGHGGPPASVGSCDPIRPPPPDARQLLAHGESQERLRRSLSSLGSQTSLLLPEPPTAIGLPSIAAAPSIETNRRPSLYDNIPTTSTATRAGTSRQQQPRVNVSPSEQPGSSTVAPSAAASLPSGGEHAIDEAAPAGRRQLWVIRHGERVDFTYGQWIPYCFDEAGNYVQKDLNMPVSLRTRKEGPSGFSKDSPITQTGRLQARLTGEAMRRAGVTIDHVFCSPSLRCVETAYFVLTGLGLQTTLRMCVEPALFEWLVWYRDGQPDFLSPEQLQQWGFPVDPEYRPLISVQELRATQESCEQYYQRSNLVSQQALRNTEGNILLVGHAATIDTCTRQLIGKEPRVASQMTQFLGKIPYCSIVRAEERSDGGGWELVSTGFPPLTHSHNQRFDINIIK